MNQDKVYTLENPNEEGHTFYLVPSVNDEGGLTLSIFSEEPSKMTDWSQAVALVEVKVEEHTYRTEVTMQVWDHQTDKHGRYAQNILLVREEKEEE